MRKFDYSYLAYRTWDNEIMSYISKIHEYKGKQELFLRQKPVELNRLIEIAKIQSTEASNRIEGIITTNARLKQLVADKTTSKGLFNVVSAMDSLEEMVEEGREITTVKGVDGIAILAVGLPLLHGMIDVGLVVVSLSELNHFATHKDVLMTNGSNEGYTFKRSAA